MVLVMQMLNMHGGDGAARPMATLLLAGAMVAIHMGFVLEDMSIADVCIRPAAVVASHSVALLDRAAASVMLTGARVRVCSGCTCRSASSSMPTTRTSTST